MFLRWRRVRTQKEGADFYYIRPELVESFRDEGKVRQRTIKYLGSIQETWAKDGGDIEYSDHKRSRNILRFEFEDGKRTKFWETVNRKLHDLESEREGFTQIDAVKTQIAKRVDRVVFAVAEDGRTCLS